MNNWLIDWFPWIVALLMAARVCFEWYLEQVNRRHVQAHSNQIPSALQEVMDATTYRRSVDYTLAKSRFGEWELLYDTLVLAVVLFSGILPWVFEWTTEAWGNSAWAHAGFLVLCGLLVSVPGWPWQWYEQFRLEERFGFNTMTLKLWWMDRVKGLLLGLVLGYPLLVLIFKWVEWTGSLWWFWAWVTVLVFQLIMMILAPMIILPLFNKFEPLKEGSLRNRLFKLAERAGFHAKDIQVMDGSKRSLHSNAFFTGFGRFRKIVLFDTLLEQLRESELEAVLSHEIGHYKKRHIPKMLAVSALTMLAGFFAIGWLSGQEWLYKAFGFPLEPVAPAFLLFGLLSGLVMFWTAPLTNGLSRKFEYEADRYAREMMGEFSSMIGALRKLSEKNLSNLTPHPQYSRFYYSHPTLLERERALKEESVQT